MSSLPLARASTAARRRRRRWSRTAPAPCPRSSGCARTPAGRRAGARRCPRARRRGPGRRRRGRLAGPVDVVGLPDPLAGHRGEDHDRALALELHALGDLEQGRGGPPKFGGDAGRPPRAGPRRMRPGRRARRPRARRRRGRGRRGHPRWPDRGRAGRVGASQAMSSTVSAPAAGGVSRRRPWPRDGHRRARRHGSRPPTMRSAMARPISEAPPRSSRDWTRPKASRTVPLSTALQMTERRGHCYRCRGRAGPRAAWTPSPSLFPNTSPSESFPCPTLPAPPHRICCRGQLRAHRRSPPGLVEPTEASDPPSHPQSAEAATPSPPGRHRPRREEYTPARSSRTTCPAASPTPSTPPWSRSTTASSSTAPSSRSTRTRSCSTSATSPRASSPPASCRSATTSTPTRSSAWARSSRPWSSRRRTRRAASSSRRSGPSTSGPGAPSRRSRRRTASSRARSSRSSRAA